MDLTDKITIVEAGAKTGKTGCTALSLSKNVSPVSSVIHRFLTDTPDLFCKIGATRKYRLNPFSKFKGNVNKIKAELQKTDDNNKEIFNINNFHY